MLSRSKNLIKLDNKTNWVAKDTQDSHQEMADKPEDRLFSHLLWTSREPSPTQETSGDHSRDHQKWVRTWLHTKENTRLNLFLTLTAMSLCHPIEVNTLTESHQLSRIEGSKPTLLSPKFMRQVSDWATSSNLPRTWLDHQETSFKTSRELRKMQGTCT